MSWFEGCMPPHHGRHCHHHRSCKCHQCCPPKQEWCEPEPSCRKSYCED